MVLSAYPSRGMSFFADTGFENERTPPGDAPGAGPQRRRRRRALAVALTGATIVVTIVLPATSAYADPPTSDWSRLRMCESSDNYSTNTGNGHYGAYQFDLSTWRSVGGSGYPNLASVAEQDARALALYRMRGWQPWQCASILGLREDASARSGRTSDITVSGTSPTSNPVAAAASVPAFPGPLYFHQGDANPAIKQFQDQMHSRGFFPIGTGDYGPNTFAMVTRLQSLNGLIPNGEIGPNTWRLAWTGSYSMAAATASPTATPSAPSTPTTPAWPGPQYFSVGDHSTTIKQFQDQMHARGFFPVGTGDFGPNTLDMVKRLQGQNGLPETGLLGPVTWRLAWSGAYTLR